MRFWVNLSCLVLATSAASAEGIRRKHRPWFAGQSTATQDATPSSAKETAPIVPAVKPVSERTALTQTASKTIVRREKSLSSRSATVRREAAAQEEKRVAEVGPKLVRQAEAYKGTRYSFGGTTKKGLDCSGLVSRVWQDLQMKKIPRASAALYKSGHPVELSDLRPGDLVFFKNTYRRGISHVGVYAGGNRFVHASSRHGVTVTKLSDPYYQLHYAGARRLY